jgi:hypothetical protein
MEKLHTHCIAAKFVLQLLSNEQEEQQVAICQGLLQRVNNEANFLQNIVTGDEAWVYYDETKRQSSQSILKSSPGPKKAHQVHLNTKVVVIIFFGCEGVVLHEFVPKGQAVNREFHLEVLRHL